jgi:hypothetical protein
MKKLVEKMNKFSGMAMVGGVIVFLGSIAIVVLVSLLVVLPHSIIAGDPEWREAYVELKYEKAYLEYIQRTNKETLDSFHLKEISSKGGVYQDSIASIYNSVNSVNTEVKKAIELHNQKIREIEKSKEWGNYYNSGFRRWISLFYKLIGKTIKYAMYGFAVGFAVRLLLYFGFIRRWDRRIWEMAES